MDIKFLKSFITLSQSKSYREASGKLFITQPTLTKQIKLLEQDLGLSLFERDNHGAKLSKEGRMIYKHALILEQQLDHFLCVVKKINTGKTGNLNIGYTSSFLNFVPDMIASFNHKYPNVNIKLSEMSSIQQEDALTKGIIDLGFIRGKETEELSFVPMGQDYLCLVASHGILNTKQDINEIIRTNNLILLKENSNLDLFLSVNDYLKSHGFDNKSRQFQTNVYGVLALVSARTGITILPHSILSFMKSGLCSRPLHGNESPWSLGLSWNKKDENKLREEFIKSVIEKYITMNNETIPHGNLSVLTVDGMPG
ncbi:LysR family transcriptional regulator [Klebsiella oxytoca]|uniref:LysR family transcriptional regulator n=1 Tax=Klebsiella oxytoca TaxID=571 RepID=UPI001A1C13BD|nr:LysR family transcriptional regulator [Klebsiella oxytoca]MBZ7265092.1 LysR family transcriptional regulator [Klebsiella oxytoca]MCW9547274.1 LysR family transcriptional regulator [Klebsiella oxytoca]HAT2828857.1 LysR family transcriptional regulator [Klebsiella oxytoca]